MTKRSPGLTRSRVPLDRYELRRRVLGLGAPTVNFLPGRLPESDAEAWRILVTILKPLLHYAGERGINMTIHNHENMVLDTPEKVRLIIEQIGLPNLKSLFDATNFVLLGSDLNHAVSLLGPHLQHCHVKGVVARFPFHHFLVPGEPGDEFDFAELAAALRGADYQGCVSVETFGASADYQTLFQKYGLTSEHAVAAAKESLGR